MDGMLFLACAVILSPDNVSATSEIFFHFDGLLIPSLKELFTMLKALIPFLEAPIPILAPLVDDIHF